jgi:hypothetical protein
LVALRDTINDALAKNIEPHEPIRTEVRWSRPWGNDFCMPGVSLKFINISPELVTKINERLSDP